MNQANIGLRLILLLIIFSGCYQVQLINLSEQTTTKNNRILVSTTQLHGFRIAVDYESVYGSTFNFTVLHKQLNITVLYFQHLLKVKQRDFDFVKYPRSSNGSAEICGSSGYQIPTKYITNGFNPNETDMVAILASGAGDQGIIYGSYCKLRGWVIYSVISLSFNQFLDTTNYDFHFDLGTLIIQFCRFLGFNSNQFSLFYKTLDRLQFRPLSEVVKKNTQNKDMIVTPNVLNYVQNYFQCNDGVTGALLQQNYTSLPQWQTRVFDDLLVWTFECKGRRITEVTLNLLKDTNYYDEVDITLSWKAYYGKGKGCSFANALIVPSPQFCTTQTIQPSCNMFYDYWGNCLNFGQIGTGNTQIITQNKDNICQIPRSTTNFQVYGWTSKCYHIQNVPQCLSTRCSSDRKTLYFKVGENQYACDGSKQTILVPQLSKNVTCPSMQIVCSTIQCPNWCNQIGVCINGICINICQDSNCLNCEDAQGKICSKCKQGYYLNLSQITNQCSLCDGNCMTCQNQPTNCISCDIYSIFPILNNNKCIACGSHKFYQVSTGQCLQCLSNCASCLLQASKCIQCVTGKQLVGNECFFSPKIYGGFYQLNQKIYLCELGCQYCHYQNSAQLCLYTSNGYGLSSGQIFLCRPNCQECNSISTCTKCFTGFYLQSQLCLSCSQNCLKCSNSNCETCLDGYFVNFQNQCQNCSIQHCQLCSSSACTKCQDGYVYLQQQLICQQCPSTCITCSSANIVICLKCGKGYFLNGTICSSCSAHCIQCSNSQQCLICENGYFKNQKLECLLMCEFPCFNCTDNQPNQCKGCFQGYVLNGTKCTLDVSFSNKVCPLQYRVYQNSCISCQISNCASCSLINQIQNCKYCFFGFYLDNNNSCLACQQGCQICLNNNYCQSCSSGYIKLQSNQNNLFQSNQCFACLHPCKTCIKRITQCLSCQDGFSLIGIKCIKNVNIKMKIILLANFNSFTQSAINTFNFGKDLLNILNEKIQNMQKITITSIVEGSVAITAIYNDEQLSSQELCNQNNNLKKQMSAGNLVASYSILSSSFENLENCVDLIIISDSNSDSSPTNSNPLLIIVLAIAIPLVIVVICIIICLALYCKYYKNSDEQEQLDPVDIRDSPVKAAAADPNALPDEIPDTAAWLYNVFSRNAPYIKSQGIEEKNIR